MCMATLRLAYKQMQTNYTIAVCHLSVRSQKVARKHPEGWEGHIGQPLQELLKNLL